MQKYCEEVLKLLDGMELNLMIGAQKEGMDPLDVKAFYNVVNAKNPIEEFVVCLERLGYDKPVAGKPNLCPGTQCFEDGVEYVQLWNDKKDAMFVVGHKQGFDTGVQEVCGMKMIRIAEHNFALINYVGPEKYLEELGLGHNVFECPNTGKGCDKYVKVYQVDDIKDVLLNRFTDKQKERLKNMIIEEAVKVGEKKETLCAKCKK